MTKREMFNAILSINAVAENQEMVDFINHELELLDRKSSTTRKPTKTQLENEGFKADILATLAEMDEPVTVKELQAACPSIMELTNQRITHMLTDLRKAGEVKRTYIKKVAYFELGVEETEEEGV